MDHLERYEDLISAIKANGVPADYLLCKLFKHSLTGEALQWLKQLPPGSLTAWDDIKNAFLIDFFDEVRAEELRSKIATFMQKPTELFDIVGFVSSLIREIVHTTDSMKCSCSALSSEV
ncbi:hypothetical protein Bca101_057800 [Brassica carinata]